MKTNIWTTLVSASFLLLCALLTSDFILANENKSLRLIALTDLHGALEAQTVYNANKEPVLTGGAALISSYINALRESDNVATVLVDAGDLFQGTLVSNTVEGRSVVDFYNLLQMDAVAIGNHEFDFGPAGDLSTPRSPQDDPRGALKERISGAHFPFLAANVFEENKSRPEWLKPSVLLQKGENKVGIIGFSTVETPHTTNIKNLVDLEFVDPVAPIIEESRRLREAGADFVILIGHAGGGCGDNSPEKWEDLSSCEHGELFATLKRLPPGTVDAAVGGHTHQGIAKKVNGIPVLQPFSNSRYVGWVTLNSSPKVEMSRPNVGTLTEICGAGITNKKIFTCNAGQLKNSNRPLEKAIFMGKEIVPDPAVVALLKPDFDRVVAIKDAPLGITALTPFSRDYYEESALGNMLAIVLQTYPEVKDVDAVLLNNGGLRDNLDAKDLTYGDIFNILPFDNILAVMEVKGDIFLKMMEMGVSHRDGGISWSGVSFTADHCKVSDAQVNGVPLDLNRTYRILTSDFIALGGSHFDSLHLLPEQIQILYSLPNMREALVEAIKKFHQPLLAHDYYDSRNPHLQIVSRCGN